MESSRTKRIEGTTSGTAIVMQPAPEGIVFETENGGGHHPVRITPRRWREMKDAGDELMERWFELHGDEYDGNGRAA